MSRVAPVYSIPDMPNQKWADIEAWRVDLLATFMIAANVAGADPAHWTIIRVDYDEDGNVTVMEFRSPTGDEIQILVSYTDSVMVDIRFYYKQVPYPNAFEFVFPGFLQLNWVDGFLETYTWI